MSFINIINFGRAVPRRSSRTRNLRILHSPYTARMHARVMDWNKGSSTFDTDETLDVFVTACSLEVKTSENGLVFSCAEPGNGLVSKTRPSSDLPAYKKQGYVWALATRVLRSAEWALGIKCKHRQNTVQINNQD